MLKQKGFSLIELLIVVTIIGIIAAIAIPNFLAARRNANQASAVSSLRTIFGAEVSYKETKGAGTYGNLTDLKNAGMLDSKLASGNKSGYSFNITFKNKTPINEPIFDAYANAISFSTGGIVGTGSYNYYVNETGIIYENEAGQDIPPTAVSDTDRTVTNGNPVGN